MTHILQTISFSEDDIVKSVSIDFCFRSDVLDPKTLTEQLNIIPTRAWAKDETYLGKQFDTDTKKVVPIYRKRPWGIWAISSESLIQSKRAQDHALYLVELLEPKKDIIQKYLGDYENYTIRFLINWEPLDGHGSYELSSNLLQRMTFLSHYIEFDYFSVKQDG